MRRLIIFLILLFFPISVQAQLAEDRFFEINDFSGMLKSHLGELTVPSNSAKELFNLRANVEFGSINKRETFNLYGNCRSSAVKALHRYYKSDDTKYLLVASGTYLDLGDDNGGACTELTSGLTDGKRWSFLTYKDVAIGMNGFDDPIKYDGHTLVTANTDGARTAGDLATELGAPFAELNTGSNLDASSWYQYKMGYYDGATYSYSETRSNPILTGSSVRDITLTDIPLGPSGTTTRYLYRTSGAASRTAVLADTTYYLAATISDNSTRTYNDTATDATIEADPSPTRATVTGGNAATPPIGRFGVIHKERLWVGNEPATTNGKSLVSWSDTLNPDYFDLADFELVRPDDGDEITFLKNQLGNLVIGKTNTINKFFTDASSSVNWSLSTPFSFVGCPAPYSAVNTPTGITYLGRFGLYSFNGQNSSVISDVLTKDIRDINSTNIDNVFGIYHDNKYYLTYTSIESGAGENDRVLIYDSIRNAYMKDTANVDSFVSFNSGTDFGTLYSGSSGVDGKILAQTSNPTNYIIRYLSDLQSGTADSVVYTGVEDDPAYEIGWGVSIDTTTLAGVTLDSTAYSSAVIDRPETTGYWYGPVIQINASNLSKLFWNENLKTVGDATYALRTAATSTDTATAAWSSEFSNPSGSDISSVTANNFLQIRSTLTTSDITISPEVFLNDNFLIKMSYSKTGTAGETSILGTWESGYMPISGTETAEYPKRIKEILVFYEGTEGTLNFRYKNLEGDIDQNFDIDLSVNGSDNSDDDYFGDNTNKIHRYLPPAVIQDDPVGRRWKLIITESGTTPWSIKRIVIRYDIEQYYVL